MAAREGDHLCFIINSLPPYCYDFNEILALPSGFIYRNRFDIQWVQPQIRTNITSEVGARVLLVLRDMPRARLVPARWATVTSVQLVGNVAYFEYELGDLIAYSQARDVITQEIIAITKKFHENHPWLPGNAGELLSEPSVLLSNLGNDLPTRDAEDLSAWGNLVAAVSTADVFEGVEFLKIVGLTAGARGAAKVVKRGYMVQPGKVYELRVFQTVPRPGEFAIPAHGIDCNSFSANVELLRSRQHAVGKYDMLTFILRCKNLSAGERTAIEIPHVPDAVTGGLARSSLYIPLTALPSPLWRRVAIVLLLVLSIGLTFRPELLGFLGDAATIRNLATLLVIVILTGPSRAVQSIWPTLQWRK
jgi:hypothetical protein